MHAEHTILTDPIKPVERAERSAIVDSLRGFALLGVLFANFTSYNEQQVPAAVLENISSPFDRTLMHINSIFLEHKFMTLFSILFGYGFGLILASLEKKNIHPNAFFIRRMCWLFVFGIVHALFWWGDVLHLYAVTGALLLLFRKLSPRIIFTCALFCMLVIPGLFSFIARDQPDFFNDSNIQKIYAACRYGNILDVFRINLTVNYNAFIVSGTDLRDIAETLGRFLFGYFLLRIQLFERIETKAIFFRKMLLLTTLPAIAYLIIRWMSLHGKLLTDEYYWQPVLGIGILSTTCFYSCLVVLAFISFGRTRFFKALQALGRMTLTNYLLISAIMVTNLYGIGLGQLGTLPMHTIWLMALEWLLIEIVSSAYWSARFRYGPLEWIWRQLTYAKRLPLRK